MSRLRTLAAAFAVTAVAALVTLTPGTARAEGPLTVTVDCVTSNADGTYTAVFGYNNGGAPFNVPIGRTSVPSTSGTGTVDYYNSLNPNRYQGATGPQPTTFQSGANRAAFTVTFVATDTVNWRVNYPSGASGSDAVRTMVTASPTSPACVSGPELPAAGNGYGQLLVLAGSTVIIAGLHFAHRRRAAS